MKNKISVSIEEEKIKQIEKFVESGKFRNKSHAVEQGLDLILKENLEEKK